MWAVYCFEEWQGALGTQRKEWIVDIFEHEQEAEDLARSIGTKTIVRELPSLTHAKRAR